MDDQAITIVFAFALICLLIAAYSYGYNRGFKKCFKIIDRLVE